MVLLNMLRSVAIFSAMATVAIASPFRQSTGAMFTNPNGLEFTQMNDSLPNVAIFATGKPTAPSPIFSKAPTDNL